MTHTLPQIPPKPPGDDVRGFLPDHEGQQLFEWANQAALIGPLLELSLIHISEPTRQAESRMPSSA